jgi:hypothetical protein
MQNLGNISDTNAGPSVEAITDREIVAPIVSKGGIALDQAKSNQGWILNPALDYLLVCGGLMWLLYAVTFLGVTPVGSDPGSRFYGAIIYWGSILFTEAHGPATLVRVFESRSTPKKIRYLVAIWTAVLLAVACAAVSNTFMAQAFTKITLMWLVQHYIAQTFGIVLIYCFKRDYKLDSTERFVFQGHLDNFMGLEIPFWGPLPWFFSAVSQLALECFTLAFVVVLARHYRIKKEFFPLPGLLAIISVAAITLSARNGFYLLGITFYHASQYLAITFSYFLKEKALDQTGHIPLNLLPQFVTKRGLVYFVIIVAAGYFSTYTVPVFLIKTGLPSALVLCSVYALLNCVHILADALIWRIRDVKVRQLLV